MVARLALIKDVCLEGKAQAFLFVKGPQMTFSISLIGRITKNVKINGYL